MGDPLAFQALRDLHLHSPRLISLLPSAFSRLFLCQIGRVIRHLADVIQLLGVTAFPPRASNGEVSDERIQRAIAAVVAAANGRHPSVNDLARSARLSPSHFAHLFQQCTGTSPLKFLKQAKLAEAALLLKYTSLSVKEVAWNTGFRDLSHFVRRFKTVTGLSPRRYRSVHSEKSHYSD